MVAICLFSGPQACTILAFGEALQSAPATAGQSCYWRESTSMFEILKSLHKEELART